MHRMARYMCSSCHEVVESIPSRFAFCEACGQPLTTEEMLPIQAIVMSATPAPATAPLTLE